MAKKKISSEEMKEISTQREVQSIKELVENGSLRKPTRMFNVGDQVRIGALKNVTITEVLLDGHAYKIHYDYMGEKYGMPDRKVGDGIWNWISIFPINSHPQGEVLSVKDDIQIRYYNNDIDSLLHKVYNSGVDLNPKYQRELVWTNEQKTSLLDSIFNNIEIGKFTFIKHPYEANRVFYYEILDGKQRLSTMLDFYEDRIEWKGKKFTELCPQDARHFKSFPIIQAEVGDITEQQIYKLFIKMNISGTPVSKEHLDKIKSLIK